MVGEGEEQLLWQSEVNQHSVHAASHHKLLRTTVRLKLTARGERAEETPQSAAAQTDNDTAISSHRRDRLHFSVLVYQTWPNFVSEEMLQADSSMLSTAIFTIIILETRSNRNSRKLVATWSSQNAEEGKVGGSGISG